MISHSSSNIQFLIKYISLGLCKSNLLNFELFTYEYLMPGAM